MKHKLFLQRFFASLLLLVVSTLSWAYDFMVDGIYYDVNEDGSSVTVTFKSTSDRGYSGSVTIPSSVTYNSKSYSVKSIGDQAFRECTGLTSVVISEGVEKIGLYGFQRCYNLTSVVLPSTMKFIDNYAFQRDNSLASIVIPEGVTFMGYEIFALCTSLKSASLPETLTEIYGWMFYECTALKSVKIPSHVTTIGNSAFYNCTSLTEINIPESVTGIDANAFYGCTGFTSIKIPGSVTRIDNAAFFACPNLTKAEFASIESLCKISFGSYGNPLTYANHLYINGDEVKDVVIPNSVTRIGNYAFTGCTHITSVTIPNSVTNIGDEAFYNCFNLNSVTIPGSVKRIGKYAFGQNTSLASVTISEGVTMIDDDAFFGCETLTSIAIPNSVTNLGYGTFRACSSLATAVIGSGVTSISERLFESCALSSIDIPDGVTEIGPYAFGWCEKLSSVNIPGSVETIGEGAFAICEELASIRIPNSVKTIGNYAFAGCTSLPVYDGVRYADTYLIGAVGTEVELGSYSVRSGTRWIGTAAFFYSSNLSAIEIPNSVTDIADKAFYHCSNLNTAIIGNGVTSIGDSVFSFCPALASVTINSEAVVAKKYSEEESLSTVFGPQVKNYVIRNGIGSIGDGAFRNCTMLNSIKIPESVMSVGENAFYGCTGLPVEGGIRYADTYLVEAADNTQSAYNVKSGTRFIANNAFSGCAKATSVTIPESVTSIGTRAFYSCASLESVNIPSGITNIAANTFSGCEKLASVTIPESVTSVEAYAFSLCSGLSSLVIPDNVSKIGTYAFSGCSGLSSVTLGSGVEQIESAAFKGCSSLNKVICRVKNSDRRTEDLPVVPEPVKPLPGDEPSSITDYFYPFNPAHPDDPTTANVDETVDVTIDNVYPADECKAKWLDYYKKVYNARNATAKTNTKWTNLSRNPYIKRNEDEVVLLSVYSGDWEQYLQNYADYEAYIEYMKYTTVPVPETARNTFEDVLLSDATLYVYSDVINAYKVTSPWSGFGQILPIDPLDVKEVKTDKTTVPDENAPIFDLMGRRLQQKPSSGYYIKGGKKYFVK